ncbi:MAG: glycosyltransferase family 2 protein [Candidatus Pacebacteria bacterium]|nr:glycosyltransferase family 2 protein [Candidatus Paceibacterota bacterium]
MKEEFPFVSIIIPCFNEEKYIGKCLGSLLRQDYSKEKMEILLIDGMSKDKTREVIKDFTGKYPFLRILDNPKRFTPFALNIGIKNAKGDIIIRMDAHAGYEKDYISKCVKYSIEYDADNVGGFMKTLPSGKSLTAKAIAFCLSNVFGVGGSYFRTGLKEPRWVDTVFGGCFKREVFDKIGLFNENLIRSQDMELNIRLKKAGGKILLHPDIIAYYYPKDNLKDFFVHNLKDGIWTIYPLKFVKTAFKARHFIPLLFILTLPISIWPYLIFNLFFSTKIAIEQKDIRLLFLMPIVFLTRHVGYGLGSIVGLFKLLIE